MQATLSEPIVTLVAPVGEFTNAEGYHQKYYLQSKHALMQEMAFNEDQLITDPLATRLNAYVAGFGTSAMIDADMKSGRLTKKVDVAFSAGYSSCILQACQEVERLWSRFTKNKKHC